MNILTIFAKNLKKYRMLSGLSQEKLTEKARLDREYISTSECEKINISLDNIQKIANVLKIEPYKLFLESEHTPVSISDNQIIDDITITTMCAVINNSNDWLFIDRIKNWKGLALPGGHLNGRETTSECARREIFEETGLTLHELVFKGLVHFYNSISRKRYLIFNYTSTSFSGELKKSSDEGTLLWINEKDFYRYQFAEGMEKRFILFTQNSPLEMFVEWNEKDGYVNLKYMNL